MIRAWWYGKQENGNFGDILNPHILRAVSGCEVVNAGRYGEGKILAIGSILRWLAPGDHVWGSGMLAPAGLPKTCPEGVTFHAVRGPLSRKALLSIGADVPEVYGDPGLLVGRLLDVPKTGSDYEIGLMPHYADARHIRRSSVSGRVLWIDVRAGVREVIAQVVRCERVLASCLHGIILAESLGKPARWVQFDGGAHLEGGSFKFRDYYASTGREADPIPMDTKAPTIPRRPGWRDPVLPDLDRLLAAFPHQLAE